MKLTLKPYARTRNGAVYGTGPVMRYRVDFDPPMPGYEAFIENFGASADAPRWQVRLTVNGVGQDVPGEHQSSDEALSALRRRLEK